MTVEKLETCQNSMSRYWCSREKYTIHK